jgi:hypothetical protein
MRVGREVGLGALLLAAVLVPGLVAAEGKSPPVEFEVQVVLASNEIQPPTQDAQCAELKRLLPIPFSTLRMLQKKRIRLELGEAGHMSLPSGRPLTLRPVSVIHKRLHLHFRMKDIVDTRLQLLNGKPVIVGGEAYDRGQIIVMVTPDFGTYLAEESTLPTGPQLHRVNDPR